MNGKQMDSSKVFIAAFKHLKAEVFENLSESFEDKYIDVEIECIQDIQWIVTVPAIWDDDAKNKMMEWIKMAELTDTRIKDHCILKYEPDCASLSLQYEILKNMKKKHKQSVVEEQKELKTENSESKASVFLSVDEKEVNKHVPIYRSMTVCDRNLFDDDNSEYINYLNGKKYILIDAGGGTVDIACHEFMDNFGVKELFYPTGGPWGDMYVDKEFVTILRHLFGHIYIESKNINKNYYCNFIRKYHNKSYKFKDLIKGVLGAEALKSIANMNDNIYSNVMELDGFARDIDLLKLLFGCWTLEKIKFSNQNAYFDLMKNFRFAKIGFGDTGDNEIIKIKIPKKFIYGIDKKIGKSADVLSDIVSKYQYKTFKKCFKYKKDTLEIHNSVWKHCLYDPLIKEVTDHLKGLLSKKIMQPCSYMYLVGGYTKTKYFQNKIIAMFGKNTKYNIDIIIPKKQLLCVVDGAARMGLLKNSNRVYVQSRILSKTYGQLMDRPMDEVDRNKYDSEYIKKNTFKDKNGKEWLRDCFKIFKRRGDCVAHDYQYIFDGVRIDVNSKRIRNAIYSSTKERPRTRDDGRLLCEYIIIWPDNNNSIDITNVVTFGEILKIESYPKNLRNKKFETETKYDWK